MKDFGSGSGSAYRVCVCKNRVEMLVYFVNFFLAGRIVHVADCVVRQLL